MIFGPPSFPFLIFNAEVMLLRDFSVGKVVRHIGVESRAEVGFGGTSSVPVWIWERHAGSLAKRGMRPVMGYWLVCSSDEGRRSFYESLVLEYPDVCPPPLSRLGSPSGQRLVCPEIWDPDRAPGAGLAAHSGRAHHTHFSSHGLWQNSSCISCL